MKNTNINKVYLIGSRLGSLESVIVRDAAAGSLLHFFSLHEARLSFKHAYDILLAPGFEPSDPPSTEEMLYHKEMMRMISISPVILAVDLAACSDELTRWKHPEAPVFAPPQPLFNIQYWHCPMKSGFLERFGVLDIVQDIESSLFVAADGKIVVRIHDTGDPNRPPLSLEAIDEILRLRGLK